MEKKIAVLINSLRGGGAERVCVSVCNGLVGNGWDVTLIVLNLDNAVFQNDLDDRVCIVNLETRRSRQSLVKLHRKIKLLNIKSILVFNPKLAILVCVIKFFSRSNFKIISRGLDFASQLSARDMNLVYRYCSQLMFKLWYGKLDFYIAQSNYMMEGLLSEFNLNPERVKVINNPVSTEVERNSNELGCSSIENENILIVGRLHREKDIFSSIKAMKIVTERFPDAKLHIVGDGKDKPNLENLVAELNLVYNVSFTNFTADVVKYYKQAQVLVLTSMYDAFPNVLVEAISMGVPVVAFDCPGGVSEIVEHGKNGYLVLNRDIETLAEAIGFVFEGKINKLDVINSAQRYKSKKIISAYENVLLSI